jgi:hypothetical protein
MAMIAMQIDAPFSMPSYVGEVLLFARGGWGDEWSHGGGGGGGGGGACVITLMRGSVRTTDSRRRPNVKDIVASWCSDMHAGVSTF